MLELLTIRNLAVIENASLEFGPGLNILSGETGAGKSIIVESIGLLLGARASPELIRSGCDESVVEGVFRLSEDRADAIRQHFESQGFECSEGEILIRRQIARSGRSRIFVNGRIATLQSLHLLTEGLVDFCGQHENQSLIRPSEQLGMLDRYAQTTADADECRALRSRCKRLEVEIEEIGLAAAERERQLDYVRFQLQELDRVAPERGEDETLQQEKRLLQSSAQRRLLADEIRMAFVDEDSGVFSGTRRIQQRLRQLLALDSGAAIEIDRFDAAQAELETVGEQLSRYLGGIEASDERLLEIQERLSSLADLKRKHGGSLDSALAAREQLRAREQELAGATDRRQRLEEELGELTAELKRREKKLRRQRQKAARDLSAQIEAQLQDLRMEGAALEIRVGEAADEVDFLIRSNAGEDLKPLGKVASGGELSRVMLAIRNVLTESASIGVYLFDEIDSGMGGQTAFVVGRKLKKVASRSQVICITHLAQVAAFADHQFVVRKRSEKGRTFAEVGALTQPERKKEIARMLGGITLSPKALENAQALLREGRA